MQLEKVSGIRTKTFALEAMRQRCTDVALHCPALQANNLPALKAKLRSTAPDALRSVHRPPTLSANLGTAAPLPLAQVAGSPYTVTGTIHQLEMEIDPTGHVVTETSRKRGGGSRGGKSGADKKRDWRKNRTPEEIRLADLFRCMILCLLYWYKSTNTDTLVYLLYLVQKYKH